MTSRSRFTRPTRGATSLFALGALLACSASCGGTTSLASTASNDGGGPAPSCAATAVDGIRIGAGLGPNPLDPLGFPPYALDACTLVYVAQASAGSPGELRARDLATGTESVLAPSSEAPRRPSVAPHVVAWEATLAGRSVVRVAIAGAAPITIAGAFDHAGEPRVTADAVVFTGWLGADANGDTDVFLFTLANQSTSAVVTGAGQQRFADVSADLVAASDFSEDPSGYFDIDRLSLSDIVVVDRHTGTKTTRHLPGKQAFPVLGYGGRIGYQNWGIVHPEPKMSLWTLMVGDATGTTDADANVRGTGQVQTNAPYVRPSVRGGDLEWVDDSSGTSTLYRRPMDLSKPAATTLAGPSLYCAVAGDVGTVVSTYASGAYELRGVAR